jgi:hypothetical protein
VLEWIEGIPPTTVTGPLGGAPYLREATLTRAALRPASASSYRCARLRPHPSRPVQPTVPVRQLPVPHGVRFVRAFTSPAPSFQALTPETEQRFD